MTDQQIGPYLIQGLLGSGGMADVLLAWDNVNRWPVALKVLRAAPGKDARLQQRFDREAVLLMKLRHPHIVQVYEAGKAPDGRTYIAMEYVTGGNLDDLMDSHRRKLTVAEGVYLMRRVAGAMAYAHERGIVHRDLKPGNILLRAESGEPVVTDLGIAALVGANPLTGTMDSLGTPQYMAPEQLANGHNVDVRADIYAIGVILFELLSGRLPFEGDNNWAILLRKRDEAAPSLAAVRADLDPRLVAVVDRCLQHDPARRYQTATELALALDELLPADAHPPVVPPRLRGPVTPKTPTPGGRRSRAPLIWAGGAALALVLLLVFFMSLGGGTGGTGGTGDNGRVTPEPGQAAEQQLVDAVTVAPGEPTSTLAGVAQHPTDEATPGTPPPAPTRTPTRRAARPTATPAGARPAGAPPSSTATATGTTTPVLPPITLINPPPGSCADAPRVFAANNAQEFAWRWPATPPDGAYLEVRAGPTANMVSMGRVPLERRGADGVWRYTIPREDLVFAGEGVYEWGVYLVAEGGRVLLNTAAGCLGSLTTKVTTTNPDPDPDPDPDSDGDGLPDSEDACPDEPQGANPDPNRPGCPAPTPTPAPAIDSDGDGILDPEDPCPNERPGNYPDPNRPGCPGPPPPVDSDGDGILDPEDDCPNEPPGYYPDPNRPGCPRPTP
jgi:serine/threonine-protein kinase